MYVVVETEGARSDKEWAVRGLFHNIREASKFAWKAMLMTCNRDYFVNYWCRPCTQAEEERIHCEYGTQYHILEWDTRTNTHLGTWFLSIKPFLGPHNFQNTIAKLLDVLETYIPGKLWHECMTYEKHENV